jgi:hypothetical protein
MYNSLDIGAELGLINYINDLNTRFQNLLFSDLDGYKANYLGLAQLDINGIPMAEDNSKDYLDGLFDDNYHLVLCYMEKGDRKFKNAAFEGTVELLVSVNMDKFPEYEKEGIIKEVFDIMKVTAFEFQTLTRDLAALKGIVYENKIPDSLAPYFVFKITSKLII